MNPSKRVHSSSILLLDIVGRTSHAILEDERRSVQALLRLYQKNKRVMTELTRNNSWGPRLSWPPLARGALLLALLALGLFPAYLKAQTGFPITTDTPMGFFTNVATRLLHSELGLDLNAIQVYPTNQYTPAVHRLLQVAANIYDATTNRSFNGTSDPYCPTVFRPLYRRTTIGTNTVVLINGYREVHGTTIISPAVGAPELELDASPDALEAIPPLGTEPGIERNEPLISGFPLVIGARKGFPNFNEFATQTYIYVSRYLEFRRIVINGPVVSTNQMYVANITNAFGLEAWNSYSNTYPRNLQMLVHSEMTAVLANELESALLTNRVTEDTNLMIGSWPGWTNVNASAASFVLPWSGSNGCIFLPSSTYVSQPPQFVPLTHAFAGANRNIYDVPHWFLNLSTRLRFVLVDTMADRIVDFVDLNSLQSTIDIEYVLAMGADCIPINYNNSANLFCTNRQHGSASLTVPTLGVTAQINAGLAVMGDPNWGSFTLDPYSGPGAHLAIDGFRHNLMGWSPIYSEDQGITFYKSNVFYAPLAPYRPIYVHTSWKANDPLVHYTLSDLSDLTSAWSNQVDYTSYYPPLNNLGYINSSYQPWGGGPSGPANPSMPTKQPAAKDPQVVRSDCWNFPTNQPLEVSWLGKVHRGTPWQTVFLKSTNLLAAQSFDTWQKWTGNPLIRPDWSHPGQLVSDAAFTLPTNDWHILSILAPLLNTNAPVNLASVNPIGPSGWLNALDGLVVLSNTTLGQFTPFVMSSNSPQAQIIAAALDQARLQQPGQMFAGVGDVLRVPELSMASPWLNLSDPYITDEAYEILPAQLVARLRPDSVGSLSTRGGLVQVQFSGCDAYSYAVQSSSNLVDWSSVSTNFPSDGVFNFTEPVSPNSSKRFYRSAVLP